MACCPSTTHETASPRAPASATPPYRLGQVYKGSNVFNPRAMFQGQAGDSYAYEILPPLDSSTVLSWAVVNPTMPNAASTACG